MSKVSAKNIPLLAAVDDGDRASFAPPTPGDSLRRDFAAPLASELDASRIGACSQAYFRRMHGPQDELFTPLSAVRARAREVDVSFCLHDVSNIDSKAGTVDVDFSVFAAWEDPVLRAFPELELSSAEAEAVWEPTIKLVDATSVDELVRSKADRVRLANHRPLGKGNIWWRNHYIATIRNPMDLRAFPFDEDFIDIVIVASRFLRHQVLLRANPRINHEELPITAEHGVLEWTLMTPTVNEAPQDVCRFLIGEPIVTMPAAHSAQDFERSTMVLSLGVKRKPQYYLVKVMGIQTMLVIWSWAALWLNPEEFADKMAIIITLLLTNVAFLYVTADVLPRVPYMTVLDRFTALSFLLQFILAIETFVAFVLTDSFALPDAADTADYYSRFVLPALYAFGMLLLAWRVRSINRFSEEGIMKREKETAKPLTLVRKSTRSPRGDKAIQ